MVYAHLVTTIVQASTKCMLLHILLLVLVLLVVVVLVVLFMLHLLYGVWRTLARSE